MEHTAKAGARGMAILAAGALIQILTGIPAAWGVFQPRVMEEYRFAENQSSLVLSCLVGAYGVGCVLGGYLQDRKGPRCAALWGTALLAGGLAAAGFVPIQRVFWFYLGFAAPVGLGTAFLYPAVMSCAQKWFAHRKGLATGVIGGAVGASGAFLSFFVRKTTDAWGVRVSFWLLGGLCLMACGGAALLLKDPPARKGAAEEEKQEGLTPGQMLHTRNYWLVTASVCLATPSVLLFSPILLKMGQERGLTGETAVWAVVLGSVGSAAGRLTMPLVSDRLGRKQTDLLLFALLAVLGLWFSFAEGWLWVASYGLLTFCYSGQASLLPTFGSDLFGLAHAGVNYGFMALGMSLGSFTFPLLAAGLGWKHQRHWLAVGGALMGLAALKTVRPPENLHAKDSAMRENEAS